MRPLLPCSSLTILLFLLLPLSSAQAQSPVDSNALYDQIRALLDEVETATWTQTTWETNGEKESYTEAECTWSGPTNLRLDITGGKNKGATAILHGEKVTGFKRGLLSFAKMTFDVRAERVLSPRGHDMRQTGFFDDFEHLLSRWDTVSHTTEADTTVLTYTDDEGLSHRLFLQRDPLHIARHEVYETEQLVGKATFANVVYNPEIDEKKLKP